MSTGSQVIISPIPQARAHLSCHVPTDYAVYLFSAVVVGVSPAVDPGRLARRNAHESSHGTREFDGDVRCEDS